MIIAQIPAHFYLYFVKSNYCVFWQTDYNGFKNCEVNHFEA